MDNNPFKQNSGAVFPAPSETFSLKESVAALTDQLASKESLIKTLQSQLLTERDLTTAYRKVIKDMMEDL